MIIADLHTHTNASHHAYSSLREMAAAAHRKGLVALGITNHGPRLPDAPHRYHFENMNIWPDRMEQVILLRGCEANILDTSGHLDLADACLSQLDFVLAGFHVDAFAPGGEKAVYTQALARVMENPYLCGISHPETIQYPIDLEWFVKTAAERQILVEVNRGSLVGTIRTGGKANCREMLRLAKQYGAPVLISSDAHMETEVGEVEACLEMVRAAGIGEEQIVNASLPNLVRFFRRKGKSRAAALLEDG